MDEIIIDPPLTIRVSNEVAFYDLNTDKLTNLGQINLETISSYELHQNGWRPHNIAIQYGYLIYNLSGQQIGILFQSQSQRTIPPTFMHYDILVNTLKQSKLYERITNENLEKFFIDLRHYYYRTEILFFKESHQKYGIWRIVKINKEYLWYQHLEEELQKYNNFTFTLDTYLLPIGAQE